MRQITAEPKVLMEIEETYALVLGFPTSDVTLKAGQLVKLDNSGEVSKITASTQRPLGVVASAWSKTDRGNVRVYTPFVVIFSNAIADGTIDEGDLVACTGNNAEGLPKFKKAVAGDFVVGQALTAGATTTSIKVGYFRTGATAAIPA